MNDSLVLSHPQLEDILITVKNMKVEGKTVCAIAHELSRNFQPPNPKITSWQTCFVLQCLEILRKRGDLPKNALKIGKTGRTFYYEALEKIVEERAKV
jgi:hypothetical protein